MRRVVIPELLDSDAGTAREVEESIRDLERVNRWFGGVSTDASLLRRVCEKTGRREFSLLDVGSASGGVTLDVRRTLAREDIRIRVSLLDRSATHLPRNGTAAVVGNALALPFAANSFDVVLCSLFLHHLEPAGVVAFFEEALRVARIAVLINDLQRSLLHLGLVYAGFPLFRSRLSRHDGIASVRRAYTIEELRSLTRRTRASSVEFSTHYLFRIGAVAWKGPRSGMQSELLRRD